MLVEKERDCPGTVVGEENVTVSQLHAGVGSRHSSRKLERRLLTKAGACIAGWLSEDEVPTRHGEGLSGKGWGSRGTF